MLCQLACLCSRKKLKDKRLQKGVPKPLELYSDNFHVLSKLKDGKGLLIGVQSDADIFMNI